MTATISRAFLWSKILSVPFWVMVNTLSIILYKEFHVSPLFVTFLIALKPMTALLASYWSCLFSGQNRTFVLSNLIRYVPFLFFFLVDSPWMILISFSLYMILSRGSMPVWTELFKNHVPKESQHRLFALGNTCEYLGTTIFPILIGIALDYNANLWRVLFPLTALLGLATTFLIMRLPDTLSETVPIQKKMLLPWKNAFSIVKSEPDFRTFLIGFMLGGAGLMVIQPVLPIFFVDELQFSYTEMMIAISVCKGIGYTLASPMWVRLFKQVPIFQFSTYVVILAFCFPLVLIGSKWMFWLSYVAFLGYGWMQSGSELSWHLSPNIFSKSKESFRFSETNILAVGLRGCLIPFIGNFLFYLFNSVTVMLVGSLFCLLGAFVLMNHKKAPEKISEIA